MPDPFNKYCGNETVYLDEFINDGGDFVARFEHEFAEKIGGHYAIAVNSGTSALHAALVACDVRGGEVLLPALTPAMVAFAVIHAGATPVFCDVDEETHHMSWADVAIKITKNTKAFLGISLHGLPMNWSPYLVKSNTESSKRMWLIDDCAQALGAKGIGHADITCFSFEDKKHITTGSEGGMILTDNEELATRARKFAGLGYKHMTAKAGRTSLVKAEYQDPSYERFDTIGLNYRMSQIQAAVGLAQLERLDHIVARRKAVASIYSRIIGDIVHLGDIKNHSYYTFPGVFPDDLGISWREFYNRFVEMGGDGFYAEPQCPYNEPALKDYKADCPIAEKLQKQLMLFKTNYRDLGRAERQAEILAKLIGDL